MDILAGKYAPNERMPSESSLMSTFEVSRITVRQALAIFMLVLIFTAQGKVLLPVSPRLHRMFSTCKAF